MLSLLVCCRVLLADFLADVLECLTLSSQSSLFFFDGEIEFPLKLSGFLPLLRQLLLQNLTLSLQRWKEKKSQCQDDLL